MVLATLFAKLGMSSNDPDAWLHLQIRMALWACHAIVLSQAWAYREKMGAHLRAALNLFHDMLCPKAKLVDARLKHRLAELQIEQQEKFLKCIHVIYFIISMGIVCWWELSATTKDRMNSDYLLRLLITVIVNCMFILVQIRPLTARVLDVVFVCSMLLLMVRTPFIATDIFVAFLPVRLSGRALLCVMYMNWRVSALMNACHSILGVWITRTYLSTTVTADFVVGSELIAWCCMTFLCASMENWVSEVLLGKLTVEDITQAMQRLLSGFCDAVVQLDPDLRIAQATPRLMHLISPESPSDPKALEGTLLSSHMASESDRQRYATFMFNKSEASDDCAERNRSVRALRVNLHYAFGREVSVELFDVAFQGVDGNLEHLIGMREVREDINPPDESIFQRHDHTKKTSSTEEVAENKAAQDDTQPGEHVAAKGTVWPTSSSEFPPELVLAEKQVLSASSSASSSLRSSHPAAVEYVKRKLSSVETVKLMLKEVDGELLVQEYTLCFSIASQAGGHVLQSLEGCLLSDGAVAFIGWIQQHMLSWSHDDDLSPGDFPTRVLFRPPTDACASSRVRLCADSCTVQLSTIDEVASTSENDDFDNCSIEIQLSGISQLVPRKRAHSCCSQNHGELAAILETCDDDDKS